jgi:hypothetical protein
MKWSRLFNFIGIPGLTIMGWLIAFNILPAPFFGFPFLFGLAYGISCPVLFCWIYIPMFRRKGWQVVTEIFGDKPE